MSFLSEAYGLLSNALDGALYNNAGPNSVTGATYTYDVHYDTGATASTYYLQYANAYQLGLYDQRSDGQQAYIQTASDSNNAIWTTWVASNTDTNAQGEGAHFQPQFREWEQRMRALDEQLDRKAQAARVVRDEADKRASALLEQFLSEEQRAQFRQYRYFEVLTPGSKRLYRLHKKWAGNIERYESGRLAEVLCIHPTRSMPIEDSLLAQKLMLESNEDQLRRIANIRAA